MTKGIVAMTAANVSPGFWRVPGEPVAHDDWELAAMRAGLSELTEHILSWARPHGSDAEKEWIKGYLLPAIRAAGVSPELDDCGNIWALVPYVDLEAPRVLWSCHVDTVHAKGGRQAVRFADSDGLTIELAKRKPGRCLGADDGAGVWLLLEMIRAGVPGGYVFHRGEEKGRLGSEYAARNEPDRLNAYDACVAFDRRDYADLITHQMGMRCASDAFAGSLCDALNFAGRGLSYRNDDGGSYTDSYSYADIIPECCNVSVGYSREHGPSETLNGLHLWRLRNAVCSADFSGLIVERDPTVIDYGDWGYPSGAFSFGSPGTGDKQSERRELIAIIRDYPEAVADLLLGYGMGLDDILQEMTEGEAAEYAAIGGGWRND